IAFQVPTISSVYPSAGARTTASVAILLLAPGRFSMTNDWPSRSDSHWPIRRATISNPPPGEGTDNQTHRPRWIGLRPGEARDGRQRGSARCKMQKISAGKFHFEPPFTSFDHLVGAGEQRRRNFQVKRPGRLEIDDELDFGRLHDRQIGG